MGGFVDEDCGAQHQDHGQVLHQVGTRQEHAPPAHNMLYESTLYDQIILLSLGSTPI